jgi:hypothetical protein
MAPELLLSLIVSSDYHLSDKSRLILIYFQVKNILKNNNYYTFK